MNKQESKISVKHIFKNILISAGLLLCAFGISMWLDDSFGIREPASVLFVFTVFLISVLTDSYIYGILSSFLAVLAVNYAFTFPYFSFNFTITDNLISAALLIVVSVLTSTLTMTIRKIEAEKNENERGRMMASLLRAVSHDLRTPLSSIYASASLLADSETLSDEKRKRFLDGIKTDSEKLNRMMENLLSLSRVCKENVELRKTPTVPDELIDSVMLKFGKQYPDAPLHIVLPDDILLVPMEPLLIEQVLLNLLDNAVQHATGMSEVILRVYAREKEAVFEVEDDGCGISADILPHILSGTGLPKELTPGGGEHTGIGLPVCSAIIRAHGSALTAENLQSGGARFRFALQMEVDGDEQ